MNKNSCIKIMNNEVLIDSLFETADRIFKEMNCNLSVKEYTKMDLLYSNLVDTALALMEENRELKRESTL